LFKDLMNHKGYIATILGVLVVLPVNIQVVIRYFTKSAFSEAELITITVINILAMLWVILPSRITFEGGKFKFSIED
jgi:hypothetical protein